MNINNNPLVKRIPNFKGYAVTASGEVLSLPRKVPTKNKFKHFNANLDRTISLKPVPNSNNGQLRVYLSINNVKRTVYVKNVVAANFCFKPKGIVKPIVIHKNGDKHNNAADNLEYVSYAYFRKLQAQKSN